jgi:ribosome-associated protein
MSEVQIPNSKELAYLCARVADDKKSENILIMDLKSIEAAPADYFVIASCDSEPQVGAVVDTIIRNSKNAGLKRPKVEGYEAKEWVLIDFFDVVAHIMLKKSREFYNLEKLWGDAEITEYNENQITE